MKKKASFLALLVLICCFLILAFQIYQTQLILKDIPSEVSDCMISYLKAYQQGPDQSVFFCHFEDSADQIAYRISGPILKKYKIMEASQINESLYSFTIHMRLGETIDQIVYNFVGNIDGEWKIMNNTSNIPEALQENLDVSLYQYSDEDSFYILDRETSVVFPIESP